MPDAFHPRLARIACHAGCRADRTRRAHHDRLLAVETDPDAVLELFDLAVTWRELEYPDEEMIAPHRWVEFAERHRWQQPERVERIFSLATDVATRPQRAAETPLGMAAGSGVCPTLVPAPTRPPHLSLAHP